MERTVTKSYGDMHNTLTVPCGKPKMVSFVSSIMKNTVAFAFHPRTRFPVKLTYGTAFGSASSSCRVLKSISIILQYLLKQL